MYSDRFFKENDALKEFMTLCIECGMIPEVSSFRGSNELILSGLGISIGVKISNDPVCLKISFIKILSKTIYSMQHYFEATNLILSKLIDCAKKYNIVLGTWVYEDDLFMYINLGFKIIEKSDKYWLEYYQLLN